MGDIDAPFIDLTICPAYLSAYKDDVLNAYGMDKKEYRKKGVYSPSNNTQGTDLRAIFKSVTYDIDEILFRAVIKTTNRQKARFDIDFDGPNFTEHIDITTKYWDSFGRCFSMHPKDHVLKLGVRLVDFVARMDVYIYFGHPGQFLHSNTKSKVDQCLRNHSTQYNVLLTGLSPFLYPYYIAISFN